MQSGGCKIGKKWGGGWGSNLVKSGGGKSDKKWGGGSLGSDPISNRQDDIKRATQTIGTHERNYSELSFREQLKVKRATQTSGTQAGSFCQLYFQGQRGQHKVKKATQTSESKQSFYQLSFQGQGKQENHLIQTELRKEFLRTLPGDNREHSHQSDLGRKKLTNYPLTSDTFYRFNRGGG